MLLNLLDGDQGNPLVTGIIMGVLVLAIIGLFVWNNISSKKKKKAEQEMVSSLKIGDRVMTIGGICGFVAQINDAENTFVLETGLEENKSYVKFDKRAIYNTAPAQGSAKAPVEEKKEEKPAKEPAKKTAKKSTAKKPATKKEEKAEEKVEVEEKKD